MTLRPLPIRLNRAGWRRLPFERGVSLVDPRILVDDPAPTQTTFARAVSDLFFDGVPKTTAPGRHRELDDFVCELKPSVVLDVGASDGSTSHDLISRLGDSFRRFFVTDLNLSVEWGRARPNGPVYFADKGGRCILVASDRFLLFPTASTGPATLRRIAAKAGAVSRKVRKWHQRLLIQPSLLALKDNRIKIVPYDVMDRWTGPAPDLIRIANLLTPQFFSPEYLRKAFAVQCAHLAEGGRLLLADGGDGATRFSVFRKSRSMELEFERGGGAAATEFIDLFHAGTQTTHPLSP